MGDLGSGEKGPVRWPEGTLPWPWLRDEDFQKPREAT